MKTWRFFFCMLTGVVPVAYSQALLQSVPSVAGGVPTTCPIRPYNYNRTGNSAWRQVCGPQVMTAGSVVGTGAGACPTQFTLNSPCPDPNGNIAPTFTSWLPLNPQPGVINGTWYIYMTIGSATLWNNPLAALCAPPSYSQATSTTPLMTCPPPCPKNQSGCSPIVIDPIGEGFFLTSKQEGVEFREESNSPAIQMSWTDSTHHNAWLVRPNADGSITSLAANMFGNLSPQPASDNPNGYLALAYWAEQEGCGTVERLAACPVVWKQLRLWHDQNQDGIAQPDELSTLDAAGVRDISLKYHASGHMDQYGNVFRYAAAIYDDAGEKNSRSYDVFLIVK